MEQEGLQLNEKFDLFNSELIEKFPCILSPLFEDISSWHLQLPSNTNTSACIESFDDMQRLNAYEPTTSKILESSISLDCKETELSQNFSSHKSLNQEKGTSNPSINSCKMAFSLVSISQPPLECFDYIKYPGILTSEQAKNYRIEDHESLESISSAKDYIMSNESGNPRRRCFKNPINKVIEHIQTYKINPYLRKEELLRLVISQKKEPAKRQIMFLSKKKTRGAESPSKFKCCNCLKSHCLKMYCECFKFGKLCYNCTCTECLNRSNFQDLRQQSMQFIKKKSRYAFKNVVERNTNSEKHAKGCHCKSSGCKKNYCECFQNGVKCSEKCKCQACQNGKCIA